MKSTELKRLIALGLKTIGEAGYYRQQANNNLHQRLTFIKLAR